MGHSARTDSLPCVTIILPIRNEACHITRCLDGVLTQDYPHDKLEVLVIDGMSDDGTRQIVANVAKLDNRVRLLDNPQLIVPTGLNRGIHAARGDVIIRVDGHAVIASDYVRKCVRDLARIDADCVGGPVYTVGETYVARGIAFAQSSPFGVGNAVFRYASVGRYVDTLAFGAHRREIFQRVGLFDEELVRNQDDEFNFRLIRAGGKIWLDPEIHSIYYSRSSFNGLWKQYFGYGFWKVRVIQKHGRPASWRHLMPAFFVVGLGASGVSALISRSPLWLLIVILPYTLACISVSLKLASHKGWLYVPLLPIAFATLHVSYGIGFLFGLIHFGLVKRLPPAR